IMAGHQLPLLSLIVPLYMVRCMCSWRQTWEVWPALLAAGGSFAVFQFLFATMHVYGGPELWPMTDIGGGIFSLVVTAVFLRFWQPKEEFKFDKVSATPPQAEPAPKSHGGAHEAEAAAAAALVGPATATPGKAVP